MRAPTIPLRKPPIGALLASLGLHLLVGTALLLIPAMAVRDTSLEEAIAVEVLLSEQSEQPPKPMPSEMSRDPPPAEAPPPAVPEISAPRPTPSRVIRAKQLFSGSILGEPRSREARQTLAQLDEGERIEQVCGLEAMSQVHAWNPSFEPDRIVAYSMAATKLSVHTLQADGAVFRSKQRWYRLTFTCEMARDHETVVAFSFEVGDAVPRREWAMRNLPVIH